MLRLGYQLTSVFVSTTSLLPDISEEGTTGDKRLKIMSYSVIIETTRMIIGCFPLAKSNMDRTGGELKTMRPPIRQI